MGKKVNLADIKNITKIAMKENDKGTFCQACKKIDKQISEKAKAGDNSTTYILGYGEDKILAYLLAEYAEFGADYRHYSADHYDPREVDQDYIDLKW